jgi:hypothetical protein
MTFSISRGGHLSRIHVQLTFSTMHLIDVEMAMINEVDAMAVQSLSACALMEASPSNSE